MFEINLGTVCVAPATNKCNDFLAKWSKNCSKLPLQTGELHNWRVTCPAGMVDTRSTFPCPLQMFEAQEKHTGRSVFLWGSWGGWGGSVMDMESGAADRRPDVYAASVRSPSASDRKDLVGVATAPTPFLKEPWKYKRQSETTKNENKMTAGPNSLKHPSMDFQRSLVSPKKWGSAAKTPRLPSRPEVWQPAAKYTWEANVLFCSHLHIHVLIHLTTVRQKHPAPHSNSARPLWSFWINR